MPRRLIAFAGFLVVAAAAIRVLRHTGLIDLPPNVAPVAALAMFSGAYLPRRLAFVVPISVMLASDLIIGFYDPAVMLSVYVGFFLSGAIGLAIRGRRRIGPIVFGSLAGSAIFFLLTNAAVWMFDSHQLYPRTLDGLAASYLAGLPFFRNTVFGDLGFVGLLFGLQALAFALDRRRKAIRQGAEA